MAKDFVHLATGISSDQLTDGMKVVEKAASRGADGLNVLKSAAAGATSDG